MNKELSNALLKAQGKMGKLVKDASNPQFAKNGKLTYASLAAVIETVRGPLTDAGLVLYQSASAGDGMVMVRSMLIHAESGESIEEMLPLPVAQQTPQAYGSAITYGRRYLAMAMCGLAPDDDDGNESSQRQPAPVQHRGQRAPEVSRETPEDDNPFEEIPPKVMAWGMDAAKAKAWAVECGACANDFEATNSLKKIVQTHGGRLTTANASQIFTAFYFRQMEKLNEAVESVSVADDKKIPF